MHGYEKPINYAQNSKLFTEIPSELRRKLGKLETYQRKTTRNIRILLWVNLCGNFVEMIKIFYYIHVKTHTHTHTSVRRHMTIVKMSLNTKLWLPFEFFIFHVSIFFVFSFLRFSRSICFRLSVYFNLLVLYCCWRGDKRSDVSQINKFTVYMHTKLKNICPDRMTPFDYLWFSILPTSTHIPINVWKMLSIQRRHDAATMETSNFRFISGLFFSFYAPNYYCAYWIDLKYRVNHRSKSTTRRENTLLSNSMLMIQDIEWIVFEVNFQFLSRSFAM